MQLAKRDTRLFWGGQTRNVFFGGFTILVGEMEALVDVTALCLEFLCEFHSMMCNGWAVNSRSYC